MKTPRRTWLIALAVWIVYACNAATLPEPRDESESLNLHTISRIDVGNYSGTDVVVVPT
jgi:hypothetical protein